MLDGGQVPEWWARVRERRQERPDHRWIMCRREESAIGRSPWRYGGQRVRLRDVVTAVVKGACTVRTRVVVKW